MQEVAAILPVPVSMRFHWWIRQMVKETARQLGANPGSRLAWVPVAALTLTLLLSIVNFARSFGQSEGQTREVVNAANAIRQSMVDMRTELMGEVSAIRGMVATTQTDMARAQAQIDSIREENRRLLQLLDVEELKRENLERRIRAAGVQLD